MSDDQFFNCITERRLGRFQLSRWALESVPDEVLAKIFAGMVIVRAEYLWPSDAIDYVAYAPQFERVQEGAEWEYYDIGITMIGDDSEISIRKEDET